MSQTELSPVSIATLRRMSDNTDHLCFGCEQHFGLQSTTLTPNYQTLLEFMMELDSEPGMCEKAKLCEMYKMYRALIYLPDVRAGLEPLHWPPYMIREHLKYHMPDLKTLKIVGNRIYITSQV
jgi:hypothetical protein